MPIGLVAERGDVFEDDHVDDAVHGQGHLFVFVGAPVGNELHHYRARHRYYAAAHDNHAAVHDNYAAAHDCAAYDNYAAAYDCAAYDCAGLLGVAWGARVSDLDTHRVVVVI